MPLFFLISGYLFSYYGGFEHKGGFFLTMKGKFLRLMVPYLIWNALFLVPKIVFADYSVDQIGALSLENLVHLLV